MNLLDQILANPYDDAPRLVYADQLMERGDPRGELILLQCTPHHTAEQAARHVELRKQLSWEIERTTGLVVHFERGFANRISGTVEQLVAARDLLAREPVLELLVAPGDLRPLLALPELARVERFIIGNAGEASFDDAKALQLAACEQFRELRWLEIRANKLSPVGVAALAVAPWIDLLRTLIIRTNPLGVAGVRALGSSTRLHGLKALELTSIDIAIERTEGGFAELCAAIPNIESLTLTLGAPLHGAGIRGLAASALRRLERLEMFANPIGTDVRWLVGTSWPELHHLRLSRCGLRDADAEALATATWPLRELDVSDNYIRDFSPLERAFPNARLVTRSST